MDSYTFSSDSTSSFFVKETTSDDNTVNMDNIKNSILHLSSNEELQVESHVVSKDECDSDADCKHDNMNSNEVFVITIDEVNKASSENVDIGASDENTKPVSDAKNIILHGDVSDKENDDNEPLNECVVETTPNATESFKDIKKENSSDDNQDSGNVFNDQNIDKFDMEHFLSFKTDKTGNSTKGSGKSNKKNAIIKKYFTECGSNSVKCNLCSDVLLSNLPNLILHLRHAHKNDTNYGKVWKYFTKIDSSKAKCSICSGLFVYHNKMAVLVKHLRTMHKRYTDMDFKSTKNPANPVNIKTNVDKSSPSRSFSSDVIVIQNSDGKLINQIKVNKSWKCFTKLPNSDKMICNLCKKIFTHNKTNDLLQHLHEEHQNLLSIKQQVIQQSLNESVCDEEESDNKTARDSSKVATKGSVVKKVKNPTRLRSVKSSKIWEYYTQLSNNKIKCNLCSKVLANNYSTSNLLRHLNARHIEAYSAIKEISKSETNAVKIVIENEKDESETSVSVVDMLADYESMLTPNEIVQVGGAKPGPKIKLKVSETWNYYTKLDDIAKVRCKLCKIMLSYTEGISSNLTRHLKLKHKDVFDKNCGSCIPYLMSDNNEEEEINDSVEVLKQEEFHSDTNSSVINELKSTPDKENVDVTITESVCDNLVLELQNDLVDPCNEDSQNHDEENSMLRDSTADLEDSVSDNKQRSKAWDYFKKLTGNKVVCNLCLQEMSFSKGSTYKLFRHLSTKHELTFEKHPKPRKVFAYESDSSDEEANKDKRTRRTGNDNVSSTTNLPSSPSNVLSEDNRLNKTDSNVVKRKMKVTGRTWKYFTKLDRDKAKCNICGKLFTYKLGQTSNLIKHMLLQHKDIEKHSDDSAKKCKKKKESQSESVNENPDTIGTATKKTTIVWKYFTQLQDNKAMCNFCEFPNILSYTKNSRSNLMRHLNLKHKYVLEIPGDDLFIQTPDSCKTNQSESSESNGENKLIPEIIDEMKNENDATAVMENEEEPQDMKSFFDYLTCDEKLKRCIKYENGQIKCKICSGSFVCDNLNNYEYTIRYHVQLFHAEWTVLCFDETVIKRECVTPVPDEIPETNSNLDVPESNYNELEAIANEVSSYMNCQEQPHEQLIEQSEKRIVKTSAYKNPGDKMLSDDIWKYFTKLTSQNVRCNFCSILLSFRQYKKWNLIRHLKLKHKSKLNISFKKNVNIKTKRNSVRLLRNMKSVKTLRSSPGNKSSVKNAKSVLSIKKNLTSPTKKVKSVPESIRESGKLIPEIEKSENPSVKKKNSSSDKLKQVKSNEGPKEKKQAAPSLFSSPINRKIGRTWSHFTKIEMGKAQCNICNEILYYRGTGIDLLNDHLTSKHSNCFDGSSNSEVLKSTKKTNFDEDFESEDDSYVNEKEESEEKNSIETEDIGDKKDTNENIDIKQKEVADDASNSKKNDTANENSVVKKQQGSRVWQYFTKLEQGYAKCHLCLSEISYRGTTSNLVRHLQRIHSVISLITSVRGSDASPPEEAETEQSKLLAAVDLTPNKILGENHVCFIRLNKNVVKCNFCPRILYHKSGNTHKLMSHMLYRHRNEIKRYRSLKYLKFLDIGTEVVLSVVEKRERPPVSSDVLSPSKSKVDKRKLFRSNTWLYFTKLNEQYAKCNICFNAFSFKGGSIYNLTRHLLIKHDIKLIKRYEMPYNRMNMINAPVPKTISLSKKKNETLLFYKRINRFIVRCKLCMTRFMYRGKNIEKLVNHLWSVHITKLIETSDSHYTNAFNCNYSEQDTENEPNEAPDNCVEEITGDSLTVTEITKVKDSGSTGRKISSTWNYFTELNDAEKKVKCNICQKNFCFKSGNLSNLSRHLEKNHNIKKPSNINNNKNNDCDAELSVEEKKKLRQANTSEVTDSTENKENDQVDSDQNEIDSFFSKIDASDKLQCKFCNDILECDKLPDLKAHLSSKHDIHDFLRPKEETCVGSDKDSQSLLSTTAFGEKSITDISGHSTMSKMRCKLCYKEFVFRKNSILDNLTMHLKIVHEKDLTDKEREILNGNLTKFSEDCKNVCGSNFDANKEKKEISDNLKLENIVFRHFKNLKLFKNKCKICFKYISGKRPCYHRVTNDLSIRYSVRKIKQKTDVQKNKKKIKNDDKAEECHNDGLAKFKRYCKKDRVKHFMSINLYDNRCYDCMASRQDGYCIHSLNMWIMNENKKNFDGTKLNPDYNNQVSLNNDEVQLITDTLNGCGENNIIIITDNNDTSVLNYNDIANRNDGNQDISYHIMNSINEIDDDDIKVIIYNYNSEDGAENDNDKNNVKIEDVTENPNANTAQSTQVFEDHINRIVNEINSSQLISSNENAVESNENCKPPSDSSVVEANSSMDQNIDSTPVNREEIVESTYEVKSPRSYDIEKLTELAEVSCNEQFYKRNALLNSTEEVNNISDSDVKDQETKAKMTSSGSDRCIVETIYPENDAIDGSLAMEEEYVTSNVVYEVAHDEDNVAESPALEQSQSSNVEPVDDCSTQKELVHEVIELQHEDSSNKNSEVISEDVINAIFNEVIVNLHEGPDDKELNLIKLNNDNIEIPPGLYLQNLKSLYKINKLVLYFSDINYKYKTAKCNLCRMYLEFVEPIIYNLLMHLFTHHKDKVCTEEPVNRTLISDDSTVDVANKPRKKSPVWKYFINEKNFRATCKICRFSFSYKGGAINNLSRHLRLRHYIVVSSKNSDDVNYAVDYMLSYPKRRSAIKLRSKTWNFFSKEPNDWAKCRICKKYLSYRSSTINNLTRHLRTIHSKIFNSLFTDKEPIFIKNEDGSLSENVNFTNNEENSEIYNNFLMESSNTKTRDEILQQCSYTSLEINNRRKSIVWNYFAEIAPNCGKCNFCAKVISCKGGGTSNLSRHLRSRHGIWIVLTSNLSRTFNETMNEPDFQSDPSGNKDMNDTIITQEQLHILKNRKLIHKKSKTWDYFTKETADRVRCNLCSKPLSYKCKAVHNLRRHLAKKHPSCIVKQDPVRLKLQINSEHDILPNSNVTDDPSMSEPDKKFIDITDTSVVIVDEETQLPPHRPDRNSRPKKSIVWNYFEELEYGIAKCLICSKILSFRGGGTNNLMRHLRCRHAIIIVSQCNVDLDSSEKQSIVLMTDDEKKVEGVLSRDAVIEQEEAISIVLNEANNTESV